VLTAIAFHHRPRDSRATVFGSLTAVHAADSFEHDQRGGLGKTGAAAPLDSAYLDACQLTGQVAVWRQACRQMEEEAL
jgi:hypothetical protein